RSVALSRGHSAPTRRGPATESLTRPRQDSCCWGAAVARRQCPQITEAATISTPAIMPAVAAVGPRQPGERRRPCAAREEFRSAGAAIDAPDRRDRRVEAVADSEPARRWM